MQLKDKLGPVNWQLAPAKTFEPDDFAAFLALLPRDIGGTRYAMCRGAACELSLRRFCRDGPRARGRVAIAAIPTTPRYPIPPLRSCMRESWERGPAASSVIRPRNSTDGSHGRRHGRRPPAGRA